MTRQTALAIIILSAFPARAAEPTDVAYLLGRPILAPGTPLAEVRAYCDPRITRLAPPTTLEAWRGQSESLRRSILERVVYRGQAAAWRDAATRVEWLERIPGGPGYGIRKLRYEALPGLWIPALLYEPASISGKIPVFLDVNGHDSNGKAADYKQIRCINQAKRGIAALNVEWLGMGQLRTDGFGHYRLNQLDLAGTSGLAPFYLAMKRGLDLLLALPYADPARVGVTGLSGGGWQTILISSLDPRVTMSNPVAGYSSYRTRGQHPPDLGDSEQTPSDFAAVADYTHLTALLAPRPTLLTYNANDNCCFKADHALEPLLEAARPYFALLGHPERLRSHINEVPGTHNYELDNRQAHYRLLRDFFGVGEELELPSGAEVKTADELRVALPADNLDLHRLALAASARLPRPEKADRARLREIVRAKDYRVVAQDGGSEELNQTQASWWRLRLDDAWTVPLVELTRGKPAATTLMVADGGRASLAAAAERALAAGRRVVVVDPLHFGESAIEPRGFLYMLLVASVGDRPLGIQASQLGAVARWLKDARKLGPVQVSAVGPRASTCALVAAALEEKAIAGVELAEPLTSLRDVIERDWTAEKVPELFCFGLLESFDIDRLKELVAPRTVVAAPIRSAPPSTK